MALFPELGPQYYDEKDKAVKQRMEHFYAESISINQTYWQEADTDTRFEAGDQTLWNELYGNLPATRRRQFNFNRIRRVINMINGYQRKNRKSIIVTPVENGDSETADQFTKIFMWLNQRENVLDTVSDAFHGALVTGMNLLQVWIDYRNDPISGDIRVDNCSYNSFLIDPYFRKKDLSDCNGLWKRTFVTKREAISLLPEMANEILGLPVNDARDGKFQFMPESYDFSKSNFLTYDEFYYRDYRSQRLLVDPQTGESFEWQSDDERLKRFLSFYPQIQVVESEIPTVKLAIVVQGRVLYDGPNPLGIDKYPFVPVLGYYAPQLPYFPWRVQGVVRGLRDAQYLYNRRRIIELDILESQIASGWKYKENALVDPKDVFLFGQGRGLALKEEANMTDVEQIQAPQVPPSMIQLSELLAKEIQEVSGVNEELLGSAEDDKAGILSMLRQGAGLTTLQILFDQLDASQRQLGKILLELVQKNFTIGKVKRIIEEEPTRQFKDNLFGQYDAAIEEGLNTTTQRQMQFAQLLQLREAGVPVSTNDLLEAATIQNKKTIVENAVRQEQQQAEMAQQQAQLQMQEVAARTNLANARAQADQGLGIERLSRVKENQALAVERRAEAEKDRQLGTLHMVQAMKEIEDIDLRQLEKILALANMLKQRENENASEPADPQQPELGS